MKIKTKNDIAILAESTSVECKKSVGKEGKGELSDNFWETYSAMANSHGGYVFLGIAEKNGHFSVAGLTSTEVLRKQLADIANNRNKVSVNLFAHDSFEDIEIDGFKILQVQIPRAKRQQRPVYLNNNPIGNSYRRIHEADQRMTENEVSRFLAEKVEDSRDTTILKGFTLTELHPETLRKYRQLYAVLHPDSSVWNDLTDILFLEKIGGWRRDRETNEEGLTKAGLLMFGTHSVIQEVFPFYMLDYQEKDAEKTNSRWIDRQTLDGGWSGNLYDFYHRVYSKLIVGLKTPFRLEGAMRIDDTPVHVALRETLVNTLVHADYSDRASVLVVKRPDMFVFRNPGLMRIPIERAVRGGEADCRNRILHQMFRFVGFGEQAGSGIPKILDGWKRVHRSQLHIREETDPYDQTIFELMIPDDVLEPNSPILESNSPILESNSPILEPNSPILEPNSPILEPNSTHNEPNSVVLEPNSTHNEPNSVVLEANSTHNEPNSVVWEPNSTHNEPNSTHSNQLVYPVVDKIGKLSEQLKSELQILAGNAPQKRRIPPSEMENTIAKLCFNRYMTTSALAQLLCRSEKTLRNSYLAKMVKEGSLKLAFPATPNHPQQAYTTGESAKKEGK